ncbi:sulfatase family protein [Zobellia galactanivorans]|uniref:Mucin-desulfating sulfatase, family S1-11 n=1 Tax=Zobellia galactanivorans (strain DSM 12802 / CCUG 47099 / CIP 106680 / NCIMB 13871 / Dsij) TaxID=63186 RepID=G0L151_ZOBGA|nr:sulfatase [Zobellia galactanivorans]CAZ97643.1 Mucin-desulfating sulfatase, family S1-11 [Zobellia galactanivorans]
MSKSITSLTVLSIGLVLSAFLASCKDKTTSPETPGPPNIVYIMTDDHGYQAISAYNGGLNETPNIDRIANEGIKFTRSFVTNSICSPSRAVMLTGKFSHLNGQQINSQRFDGSQMTFPKLLQKEGYQTAMIGKWHLGSDPTGFDYWNILPGQGDYYNPDFIEMGEKSVVEGYVTSLITKFSLDWLKGRDEKKPFALLMHHKAPHRCWMPDLKYLEKYNDIKFPLPDNFYDAYDNRTAAAEQKMHIKDFDLVNDLKMYDKEGEFDTSLRKFFESQINRMNPEQRAAWDKAYDKEIAYFKEAKLTGKELMEWRYQRYLEDYLRCIASVDDSVGEILDYLEENGLAENTLVVYTSDQGFYLGEHGWFDKRFMYEESFRTPLVMKLPSRFKANASVDQLVQNIDYAPTFLDLAGVEIPADMQGKSLLPLVGENGNGEWRDALYYHYYEYPGPHSVKRHYGVRTDRYKLIHFYNNIDQWELYDLQEDPAEMNNLYGDESYTQIQAELHDKLNELRVQYKDTAAVEMAE